MTWETCPDCKGTGETKVRLRTGTGEEGEITDECLECDGTGRILLVSRWRIRVTDWLVIGILALFMLGLLYYADKGAP